MDQKYVYAVFSSTPYRIGQFIRRMTGETYNHISISLDQELQTMYSFARRFYRTPFYGGFVKETPARYCVNGTNTHIDVYRIPVTDDAYAAIASKLDSMYLIKERFLYNHFSAWLYPLRLRIQVKDSFSCIEFAVEILTLTGISLTPRKNYCIGDLRKLLQPYHYFQGEMPQSCVPDPDFFSEKPLPYPLYSSLRSIAALVPRIGQN